MPAPKSAAKQELSRWKDGEGREKREGRLAVCPSWDLAARAGRSRFQVKFWPRYTGGGLAMRHLVIKILETLISAVFADSYSNNLFSEEGYTLRIAPYRFFVSFFGSLCSTLFFAELSPTSNTLSYNLSFVSSKFIDYCVSVRSVKPVSLGYDASKFSRSSVSLPSVSCIVS